VAGKSKKRKKLVKLVNKETGSVYLTYKNSKLEGKLELKKYDKKTRKHETFLESK
jgi:large subunit ribosomal protein L33